ncbi:unnamed protein product [Medioppia subpectinata]|uniref:Uncharacterized protein n=1 Tax=Medioppia subpectinata TaxID=1979941 RepID=A0A7R9L2W0_9ACAR|nr:unnamed protein product [Medioppia subpectinata]CAG2113405.1 unnamed protein product [Medioppia subpectinata]
MVKTLEHKDGWRPYGTGMSSGNAVPHNSADSLTNTVKTNSALKKLIDTKRFALPNHRNVLSGKLIYIL